MRYKDSPEPLSPDMVPAGMEDKIMHSVLRIGDSVVMASDDCTRTQSVFAGFQLTLSVADAAEAERRFAALTEGGEVRMPLRETFFSPRFGMLADRFGVPWMVIVVTTLTRRELSPPNSARTQPTHFRAPRNIASQGESSPQPAGCQDICTVRKMRSGCGIMMVKRPSAVVRPAMPSGEPFGLAGYLVATAPRLST
jgi:PhnB protein